MRSVLAVCFAYLPHVCTVDLAHGEPVEARACLHHGADLVAGCHVLVDLHADVHGWLEGRGVGLGSHAQRDARTPAHSATLSLPYAQHTALAHRGPRGVRARV
jgi:hypothetical protein